MTELAKLRFSSTFVVWAARMLTMGEKVVWYHHWALDRSPVGRSNGDHCYMSPTSMAERLGLSPYTIEEYRTALRKLSLLHAFRRPGATNLGWVALLPADCEAKTDDIAGPGAVRLADVLDLHIRHRIEWLLQRLTPDGRPMWDPDDLTDRLTAAKRVPVRRRPGWDPDDLTDRLTAAKRVPVRGRAAALGGGRGGAPTSVSMAESQLLPAVRKSTAEDGVGSNEPESEDGGPPGHLAAERSPPAATEEFPEPAPRAIDQRPADAVSDEGFAELRRRRAAAFREAAERERARKAMGA